MGVKGGAPGTGAEVADGTNAAREPVRDGAAGSVVGGYTIVARIGSGAMGTVYRAVDDGGDTVALKLLAPSGDELAARERLRREASALQRLRHPGVARVLDVELDGCDAFIVTQLVEGPTLEEEIDTRGPLDPRDLYELADQLGDALEAVHRAGVVHRDLTPSNVLISPQGPVLIDFGLAQAAGDSRTTRTGYVMGTPGYLAPELLDGGEPAPHTDWWSWAAVLAFAATGRSPFGVRPLELVLRRSREGRADLGGLEPRTARALGAALRPAPDQRWGPTEVGRSLKAGSDAYLAERRDAAADDVGSRRTEILTGTTTAVVEPVTPRAAPEPTAKGPGEEPSTAGGRGRSVTSHPVGAAAPTAARDTATGPPGAPGPAGTPAAGYRPNYPSRTGTVTAVAGALVAAAATRPGWALAALILFLLACRVAGALADETWNWRLRHGTWTGGRGRALVRLPWFAVRSLFGMLPASLIAVATGAIVALGGLWLFAPGRIVVLPLDDVAARSVGGMNEPVVDTWVLALAMLVTLLLAWWGPVAGATRAGAGPLLESVAPGWVGAGVVVVLAMVVVGLGAAAMVAEPVVVDWWPLDARPDVR